MSQGLKDGLTIGLVIALTVFAGLGRTSLWEPDEPRFAAASRHMLESGDWLTPWFNGEPRFQKPILLYWLQAASMSVIGVDELGLRLPVGLCGLACCLVLYQLGLVFFTRRAALFAALVLATSFRFVSYSRHALTDVPMLLFILLALLGFARADVACAASGRRWAMLGWGAVGLGALTKGPVAALVVAGVWLAFQLVAGQPGWLRRLRPAAGMALAGAVTLPWYLLIIREHGRAYLDKALMSELVARVASQEFPGPARGVFFYLKVWPGDAMPWTPFVLVALVGWALGWRHLDAASRRGVGFVGAWALAVLVLFSVSRYKLPHYILPLYPAFSLAVGDLFDRLAASPRRLERRATIGSAWLLGGLMLIGSWPAYLLMRNAFGEELFSPAMLLPASLVAGAIGLGWAAWRGGTSQVLVVMVALLATVYAFIGSFSLPSQIERYKPARQLAAVVADEYREGDRLVLYRDVGSSLVFYTGRTLDWLHEPAPMVDALRGPQRVLCVMRQRDASSVRAVAGADFHVLAEAPLFNLRLRHLFEPGSTLGAERFLLVSNRSRSGS